MVRLQAFPARLQCLLCCPWMRRLKGNLVFCPGCRLYDCLLHVPRGTVMGPPDSVASQPKILIVPVNSVEIAVAVPFSRGLAATSAHLLPLVNSGWDATKIGLVCFSVVSKSQLSALGVSVPASNHTFRAVFASLFFSFRPWDFPLAIDLMALFSGWTYAVIRPSPVL